ncbi:phosphoenolpyruvate synthase [Candidatus Pacearchaeota archaeon]|nr:phosphoenolpyruvate synthase [Candidatus Pacearchaeota archaeon]
MIKEEASQIIKDTDKQTDFIKWFVELNKNSGNIAGGKGANLAEIFNMKIPVPPGFVVTAQAYDYFIKNAGLNEKIKELLAKIDYEDTEQLTEITKEIRELIIDGEFPKEMEEDITEAYENLDVKEIDFKNDAILEILKSSAEPVFVAVRSSATTEDLAEASFAGQQDTYLNVKGKSDVLKKVKECFASLFTARATYYRNKKGFKHEGASLAVIVQKMINADKSGVIFSKDPTFKKDNIVIEAVWGLGEGIVSGKITPDGYTISKKDSELKILEKTISNKKIAITRNSSGDKEIVKLVENKAKAQVLKEHEIKKLSEFAIKLEEHYKKPQDIEFAIEGVEIYIVQTRPITTLAKRPEADGKKIEGEIILSGLAASPGIAVGKIKIVETLDDLKKIIPGDILVTKMTNPDMVVSMQKSSAIVTDEGGLTAHAAIVSREMGIPAIVGTQEATTKLKEGEIITVDGFSGNIYKGKVSEAVEKEVLPVNVKTKTKIKVIVDLPSFAERAAKTGIKHVGLTRIEGIIAESGKHPQYFLEQNKIEDYEEIIFKGIKKISEYFEEMWVRTSDIRTDEFQNLEGAPKVKEANPMLGMHGIRYSLKYPKILKAELNALKRVAQTSKTIGVLFPQVISVEEIKKVKTIIKEMNFSQLKIGIMVETPAAVQMIRELCEEGIDFISFGTNDLTQYLLAVDRGNQQVQELYNEMHPAILYQLGYVIRVCKKNNVETSICGQAGSSKEMVKFLVEKGIDSISVNADMANEIASYIANIEESLIKGTDKEPRQYQPNKAQVPNEKEEEIHEKEILPTQNPIPPKEDFVEPLNTLPEEKSSEPEIKSDYSQQTYEQDAKEITENVDDIPDIPSVEQNKETTNIDSLEKLHQETDNKEDANLQDEFQEEGEQGLDIVKELDDEEDSDGRVLDIF